MKRVVLVIGATGLTGRYFIQHAERLPDWQIIGASRRPPDFEMQGRFVPVDLSRAEDARAQLGQLAEVTDLVFAGFVPAPTWAEQVAPNLELLVNAVRGLEAARGELRRVVLIQGMKYYGNHLGPFKTPAKEDDPRHMPPNYYYAQQDFLEEARAGKAWTWTCLRPHVICGYGARSTQNLLLVVGLYATICKELGLPLNFPGTAGAFAAVNQATDARLLAQAVRWAIERPDCANQAFNITNGDFFRWRYLWPKIAAHFGLPPGDVQTLELAAQMADKSPLWDAMVKKHGLVANRMEGLVHWPFADYILRTDWDVMASTIKARQFGFEPCVDSETMFLELLADLQQRRVLPP